MSANQDPVSIKTQGVIFDQKVVYFGQEYLANHNAAGVYHLFDEIDGHKLLDYCNRCSRSGGDGCLGNQLMGAGDLFSLEEQHFVDRPS